MAPSPNMLHNTTPVNRLTVALCAAAMALGLVLSGCATSDDEMTNAVVSGEKPVAMEGRDSFFGGKIDVRVTLSRGIGHGLNKGRGRHTGDATYKGYADSDSKMLLGSPLPPVTLHLILTNRSAGPMTVTMIDFDSDMGNFAIDPEVLTIGAGETGEPTPMVSQLGVNSDEMAFKVTLKYGATRESRTFPVRLVAADPAQAPGAR